jgi:hypothetical protein
MSTSGELDYVMLNPVKRTGRYHRPVRVALGITLACGANQRDMQAMNQTVARTAFRREPCIKCWSGLVIS